jgi:transposase InsO family protein
MTTSRKTWIYFLKTKDEVFDRFKEFRALVKNQSRGRIRVLRLDNGGEYTSNEFVEYCVAEGIKKELTVPYNLQQNGVAERKNRTIVGATRAMIHDQGISMFLWAEACCIVVYMQNSSPHSILGKLTLEEVYTSTRLDVSHLRIFGSVCYCHVPSEKRTKLDPTGEKGILVGYSEVYKAYCIFVPTRRRIVVSRDVQFEERALRRSRNMPAHVEDQQGQDSWQNIEEVQSTESQAQGTGTGTSVERETGG